MEGYSSNQLFGVRDSETGAVNNNPNRMIPFEKCIEILDDCKNMGVRAIQATGGGEPTVHPQHREIFQAVLDRGLDLALVTNGVIFRDGLIDILLRAKWVRISVDAGNAATYAAIREVKPSFYDRVHQNIAALTKAKRESDDPAAKELVVGYGFVVTRENWREVVDATRIAREIGVDNLRISAVFQPDDERYFEDFHAEAAALCRQAESLSTPTFRVFNNFGERVQDLREHSPDYSFCGYQQLNTYIGADLNCYRCCVQAYNAHGLIGSIAEKRFRELWESEEKRKDFERFDARSCDRCQFNSKNRTIIYALSENPQHANFI